MLYGEFSIPKANSVLSDKGHYNIIRPSLTLEPSIYLSCLDLRVKQRRTRMENVRHFHIALPSVEHSNLVRVNISDIGSRRLQGDIVV